MKAKQGKSTRKYVIITPVRNNWNLENKLGSKNGEETLHTRDVTQEETGTAFSSVGLVGKGQWKNASGYGIGKIGYL